MSAVTSENVFSSALIGMACRFPGARDINAYWQLLRNGQIAISGASQRFKDSALRDAGYGGFVEQWADFDPGFFRLTPAEATAMDPQQRWLMMLAWETLEDAGYLPASLAGKKVGVFIGLSSADYAQWYVQAPQVDMHTITGLAASVAAHRISYFFDFKGPSLVVDTACSSALTAMHLAQEALRAGDCEYALVGAANCMLSPLIQAGFDHSGALSPTGECTPFGAGANGMVRGEGAGMVLLARTPRTNDRIYAHLQGSAINQDGLTQGLSAPGARGQKAVIQAAQQRANVSPDQLFYIEAHGTGTPLGDPIEARGLAESVGHFRRQHQQRCGVGSVKRQLGHLEAAAGIASVIKVALGLYYGEIPGSLTEPLHAGIPFEKYGLQPLTQNYALMPQDRFVGVSAFGFGGGNAHLILKKAEPVAAADGGDAADDGASPQLIALSAKTPTALAQHHQRLSAYLSAHPDTDLATLQATLWSQRQHHRYRASYASKSLTDLQQQLQNASEPATPVCDYSQHSASPHAVFVFAGMGGGNTQRQLAQSLRQIPTSEADFQELSAAFKPHLSPALSQYLAPEEGSTAEGPLKFDQSHQQALTFVVQVMLFRAYQRHGVQPRHVIGASMGEITAAYCAGLLPLEAAAELLVQRVMHLQTQIGKGRLAVVGASVEDLKLNTLPHIEVAGINGPALTIVAGENESLQETMAQWQQAGIFARDIPDATAPSHTRWIEDLKTPLLALSQRIAREQRPSDPEHFPQFWSTVSQSPLPAGSGLRDDYWWQNVRSCVQLFPTLLALQAASPEPVVFFECNLQSHLSAHLKGHIFTKGQHKGQRLQMHHCALSVDSSVNATEARLLQSVGWFWERGVSITRPLLKPPAPLSFPLPPYAWDLKTYVHPQPRSAATADESDTAIRLEHPALAIAKESGAEGTEGTNNHPASFAQQLQTAPASAQLGLLVKRLREELAEVLQQPQESIAEDMPLKSMGIGSLVGMELYNRIQKELSLQLPLSEILRGPSLRELAQLVLSHLHPVAEREAEKATADTGKVDPVPSSSPLSAPLSPAQLRFWLMDRWLPGLSYHIPVWLRLTGPLDVSRLHQAFVKLQERHVLLRTVFAATEAPMQSVQSAQPEQHAVTLPLAWEVLPLPGITAETPSAELAASITRQARQPFAYETRPPFRVSLFKIDADHHELLIDMHHLIADGYSFKILFNDLKQLYLGEPLPAIHADFYDYARSLASEGRRSAAQTAQLMAWKDHLAGVPHFLELPTDYARPPQLSSAGRRFLFTLESPLLSALEELSKHWGVSTFSLLMAAFQVLIYRASGQEDFLVGTPVLGREQWQWQEVVGPFLNMLPLRSCPQNTSLQSFAQHIHQELLQAFDRQSTPFEHIAEALAPERRSDWSPLIQAVFALHAEIPMTGFGPITVEHGEFDLGISRFDLAMTLHPETLAPRPDHTSPDKKRVLRGAVEYRSSLFSESTIAAWVKGFLSLLTQWVSHPADTALSVLTLNPQAIPASEGLDGSSAVAPPAWRLWHPVALHARQQPMAVALRYLNAEGSPCSLSYLELWQQATALAEQLNPLLPSTLHAPVLATALPAGPELIIVWLGIVLAGAAYAPLDPHQPLHRLQQQLQSLQPNGLFIASHGSEGLMSDPEVFTLSQNPSMAYYALTPVAVSEYESESKAESKAESEVASTSAEALAYVILTSGTTGTPKGVKIRHCSVYGLVSWHQAAYGKEHRVAQWANPIFDAASWEIWATLSAGAELHLLPLDLRHDPLLLHAYLQAQQITQIFLSSAFLSQCFQAWPQAPDSLQQILTGGSALHRPPPPQWKVPVFLHYGPTENTVVTSVIRVRHAEDLHLGSALPGHKLYVLDPVLQPLPEGFHGQLAISGPGLTAGYLQAPASQGFMWGPNGERLYLTGDRVHHQGSALYFKGRLDRQLKLRGIRTEAREIESALCQLPDIQQAFVDLCPVEGDHGVLRAWLVSPEPPQSTVLLKEQLAAFLPQALWPQHFHWLRRFPLTAQGKIDRRALHGQITPQSLAIPESPSTFETLKSLWETLLKVAPLQPESRFFHAGGHSLLALELQHAIHQHFGLSLPLSTLFQNDRLDAMATLIAGTALPAAETLTESTLPLLTPGTPPTSFELTPVQQAYWIGAQTQARDSVNAQAYLEIHYPSLDLERLAHALQQLWIRHPMLRMHISPEGKQSISSVEDVGAIDTPWIPYLDWRNASPDALQSELEQLRLQGLSAAPEHTPHFHLVAVHLPTSEIKVCLWINALMADASSLMILAQELEQLYLYPERPLPSLSLAFGHWMDYLQQLKHHPLYLAHRQWWLDRLPQIAPPPRLPRRSQEPSTHESGYGRLAGHLSAEQWQAFEALATARGITATCLLLSVFTSCLAQWNQREAMTLNLTTFSRLPVHPQIQQVVGDFTQLSLLTVTPQQNFWEQTQQVQQQLFEVMDHALFSGMEVMRALRAQSQTGSFPVVFTSALGYGDYTVPLQGQLYHSQTQTPQVELDHQVMLVEGALHYHWDYPRDTLDPRALQHLFDTWQQALQELLETGTVDHSVYQWPTPASPAVFATDNPFGVLHLPYLQQSLAHPERVAVITESRSLSYGRLLQKAYALMRQLAAHFARESETLHTSSLRRVALYFPPGAEQVLAVLGVLWAEGTYIPLSLEWPLARLEQILAHADCRTVLCLPEHLEALNALPAHIDCMPLAIAEDHSPGLYPPLTDDGLREAIIHFQTQAPLRPAYLIFTSGSTGTPKGVILSHGAVSNTIRAVNQRLQLQSNDRIFGISALSFDLSVYDIFGALWAGAAVVYPNAELLKEPAHWWRCCQQAGVTIWNSVPGLMEMLVFHGQQALAANPRDRLSLRAILLSGDWIPLSLPPQLPALSRMPLDIYSLGGATEGAIWSIWHPITPSPIDDTDAAINPSERNTAALKTIPYGTAMPGQGVYVLDPWASEMPVAQTGEIYLAGSGVAEGYLKAPTLTAQHFFAHPHTGEALYRTGDLGYRDAEGLIHLLGRQDQQVKVGGYRIELSEITHCAERYPGIRRAVALCVTRHKQKLLALCWEPETAEITKPDLSEAALEAGLKAHLAAQLPAYMQPTLWQRVASWPHTANGKLHREALEKALLSSPASLKSATEITQNAENAWTLRLREAMAQVLQFSDAQKAAVTPDTDLLSLGIHSLEMVQLSQHFTQIYGKAPGIGELLRLRTLSALADYYADTPWPLPKTALTTLSVPETNANTRPIQLPDTLSRNPTRSQRWRSRRDFQKTPLSAEMLGDLLACLRPVSEKRDYAAASGLYAVHLYVHLKQELNPDLKAGLWRYEAESHALVLVQAGAHWPYPGVLQQAWTEHAQWGLYLIADLDTLRAQYGADARDYALIEAGSMVQLLREQATEALGLCLLGKNDLQALGAFCPPNTVPEQWLITLMAGALEDLEAGPKESAAPGDEWEEWVI